ncbi:site-specific integrase [Halostagnicola sp. A-GB9-2]|uniref:site-specific integrase n=1 Tax=Halostagnicola sp. A-GB9-2 TaxID=3048066 RepID=UPI0024BF9B7C|nr:site-specific integrase [Halostagnicola sp. A-GB9-2]MDJ1433545.1 site-specific integrase [Halostagnicola sp. A-GB9-2]
MSDPADRVDTLRDRIRSSEDVSDADRDVLLEFSDELFLRGAEYSDHRHEKLLRHCTRIAEEVGGLADALEDRAAAKSAVRWVNRQYDNEETNRDYRVAIRVFGKHVTEGSEPPESLEWISGQTSSSYDPKPDPRDMLHWEEHALPMIEACHNNRDKAMIAVAWDSGARSGEFRSLRIADVTDHEHGLQVTVDGKTGQRTITLIPSVPYLNRWLQDHPTGDRDDPLWTKLHSGEGLSYQMFKKAFESAAERAGVERPVTLTNFRKSSASHLASQGMNQAHIEEHHGWTRGSKVAARYVSVFGDAADNELAKIHGKDVSEDEPDPIAPVPCPRCNRETPRDEEFCVWCGQAIARGAVETLKTDQRKVQRVILGLAKNDPEILDDVEEREQVISVLEEDAELQERAQAFVDELGIDVDVGDL